LRAVLAVAILAFASAGLTTGSVVPHSGSLGAIGATPVFPPTPVPASLPIQHIVMIMQENHAYDNFFGTYCQVLDTYCPTTGDGIPAGTCIPYNTSDPAAGCIRPRAFTNLTNAQTADLPHTWNSSHAAFDNGSMDGWFVAENYQPRALDYFNGSTIPSYWNWAEQYALGDDFFSSYLSYSLSNHWGMFAGAAPPVSQQNVIGLEIAQNATNHSTKGPLKWFQREYLNESNTTPTVADQLERDLLQNGSAPTWKYYDTTLPTGPAGYNASIRNGETWDYWNPMAAKNETYLNPQLNSHFVNRTDILGDARNGTLPNLSWVLPKFAESDHPISDIANGMSWVTEVLDALEKSPEWNSTVVFVSWDEYGGYFDHVPPPQIDSAGLGFRVPLLIVSPYAREGYIDPQFGYFESILHLMEWRFGLPPLTARVAEAPLPLRALDFSQTLRPSFGLPTDPNLTGPYPHAFQGMPPPPAPAGLNATANGSAINLEWSVPSGGGSVDSYTLQYGPANNPTAYTTILDGAAVGAVVSNLSVAGQVVFTLQAFGPTGGSGLVSTTFGSAPPQLPGPSQGGGLSPFVLELILGLAVIVVILLLAIWRQSRASGK
jgi:phospholipase C